MTVSIGAMRERVDAADAAGEGEGGVFMSSYRTACLAVSLCRCVDGTGASSPRSRGAAGSQRGGSERPLAVRQTRAGELDGSTAGPRRGSAPRHPAAQPGGSARAAQLQATGPPGAASQDLPVARGRPRWAAQAQWPSRLAHAEIIVDVVGRAVAGRLPVRHQVRAVRGDGQSGDHRPVADDLHPVERGGAVDAHLEAPRGIGASASSLPIGAPLSRKSIPIRAPVVA